MESVKGRRVNFSGLLKMHVLGLVEGAVSYVLLRRKAGSVMREPEEEERCCIFSHASSLLSRRGVRQCGVQFQTRLPPQAADSRSALGWGEVLGIASDDDPFANQAGGAE